MAVSIFSVVQSCQGASDCVVPDGSAECSYCDGSGDEYKCRNSAMDKQPCTTLGGVRGTCSSGKCTTKKQCSKAEQCQAIYPESAAECWACTSGFCESTPRSGAECKRPSGVQGVCSASKCQVGLYCCDPALCASVMILYFLGLFSNYSLLWPARKAYW